MVPDIVLYRDGSDGMRRVFQKANCLAFWKPGLWRNRGASGGAMGEEKSRLDVVGGSEGRELLHVRRDEKGGAMPG
jgi:hypothetical protein